METKTRITKDMLIGNILREKPAAKGVIEKYFGDGCFTCPGMMWESLSFGAAMHNRVVEDMLEEINALED